MSNQVKKYYREQEKRLKKRPKRRKSLFKSIFGKSLFRIRRRKLFGIF